MKQKKAEREEFTASETELIKQLREHPQMMVRVQRGGSIEDGR